MPEYIDGALVGLGYSVMDKDYQANLSKRTQALLGNKTSISADALKKTPIFSEAYKKLDVEGKKKFDAILSLDGDAKNVNEKELKTLLTILDANLSNVDGKEKFLMDGEISTDKSGGIYQATNQEISTVYKYVQTKAEIQAQEISKQKADSAKLNQLKVMVKDYDITNGSDLAKAINILRHASSKDDSSIYDSAVQSLFKGQIKNVDTYRDGGSREYTLNDGTVVYHDNDFSGDEIGFVTITHPDGTKEKYNPKGEKVE